MESEPRLVFVATGDIALPSFMHLLEHGPRPLVLVTQPDRPAGRHLASAAPAIKTAALSAGVPVLQPKKIGDVSGQLAALKPDIIVVMAYGQILRDNILALPRKAIINLHASLLPKYRGAACIQAAIDAGDTDTGVTSMHVIRELDAGDIIIAKSTPIACYETGASLHGRLSVLAVDVLEETLKKLTDGSALRIPQDPQLASYVPKLGRDHGKLDWNQSSSALERRIRAYYPWPGTYTTVVASDSIKRIKIHPPTIPLDMSLAPGMVFRDQGRLIVGCGAGSLELVSIQPEGGRRMSAADYLRGRNLAGNNLAHAEDNPRFC